MSAHTSRTRDVVLVNDRAVPVGGASTVALESAVALSKRGKRVTVLAGGTDVWPELVDAGVNVRLVDQLEIATRSFRAATAALWNSRAYRALRAILSEHSPADTLVHVHSWSKGLSPSVFSAAANAGFHVVCTLHDYGFVCPNAALHDFPTGQPCARVPMSVSCVTRNCDARQFTHKLWRLGRQLSLEQVADAHNLVDAAVCVTDFSRSVYRPHLPPQLTLTTVMNPIAVTKAAPANAASNKHFIYIGRLSREKGALVFAKAAAGLGIEAVFVGEGELEEEIRACCPKAVITGWLSRSRVTEWIRDARAVVVPSLWRETQGMVVFEALGNGVPVVASSNTAPASFVSDGITGILFDNGDPESLAAALTRLSDDQLVRELGAAAYATYWAAPATIETHVDSLLQTYDDVLSKPRRAGGVAVQ